MRTVQITFPISVCGKTMLPLFLLIFKVPESWLYSIGLLTLTKVVVVGGGGERQGRGRERSGGKNIPEAGTAPTWRSQEISGRMCTDPPAGRERRSQSSLNGQRIKCKVSYEGQIWIEAQILSLRIRPGINLAPNQGWQLGRTVNIFTAVLLITHTVHPARICWDNSQENEWCK